MANIRQYIGARYVIKIYQNSTDPSSAEWEHGNFEPLVMVTWQNGSYLSKKEVPATVGNPASNPNYWVQTGFYNGQIASLQAQIDAINNNTIPAIESDINTINNTTIPAIEEKIDDLKTSSKRNIIIIADSYGVEGGDFAEHSFFYYLENMLANSNADVTLHTIAARGAAFGGQHLDPVYMYQTYLENIGTDITDKNAITDIMIVGGYNDVLTYPMNHLVTDDETLTGIVNFRTYANTNYPKAKLHFIPIGSNAAVSSSLFFANINLRLYPLIKKVIENGYAVHENAPYVIASSYLHLNDNVHPSLAGQSAIADMLFNYIISGSEHIFRAVYLSQTDVTAATDVTLSAVDFNAIQTDGVKRLSISRIAFTIPETVVSANQWVPLFTLPSDCIIDTTFKTQMIARPYNFENIKIRINNKVVEFTVTAQTTITYLDLRGIGLTLGALEG